jgi:mRNA interferase MazF
MARRVARGEIWLHEFARPDKRRPVLVLSRQEVIDVLHTVTVAPIMSTIYGVPSEVLVGPDEGLKHACAVNLDHVQTIPKRDLERYVGKLGTRKMTQVCGALAIAMGCDSESHLPQG